MAQWYAVIDSLTGIAVSFGTDLGKIIPPGFEVLPIDHQPDSGERWDAATRSIVAAPIDPLVTKRKRLGALRAKGWDALTLTEKAEGRALCFDLGEPSPPA